MTESPFEISEPMTIHPPSIHGNLRVWGVGLLVLVTILVEMILLWFNVLTPEYLRATVG